MAFAMITLMIATLGLVSLVPNPSAASAGTSTLYAGEVLQPGQQLVANGHVLVMQGDGNLVMYAGNVPLWASNTRGFGGAWAVMQGDGNFVVYWLDYSGQHALFSTGTNGRGGQRIVMQGDGNVVVYTAADAPLWEANTYKQAYAVDRFGAYGWGSDQWGCLHALWQRESGWNQLARNSTSGAYGIPQALPGDRMAVEGADWRTNPYTQIRWGETYIKQRYGTPCGAWSHEQLDHWY